MLIASKTVHKDELLNTMFDVSLSPTLSSFRMLPGSAQTLSFLLLIASKTVHKDELLHTTFDVSLSPTLSDNSSR